MTHGRSQMHNESDRFDDLESHLEDADIVLNTYGQNDAPFCAILQIPQRAAVVQQPVAAAWPWYVPGK